MGECRATSDSCTYGFPASSFYFPSLLPPPIISSKRVFSLQTRDEEDPFYMGCHVSKNCFGQPTGCLRNKKCNAAVAVTVRGDEYLFELQGRGTKYVAVGLSDDKNMVIASTRCAGRKKKLARAQMFRSAAGAYFCHTRVARFTVLFEIFHCPASRRRSPAVPEKRLISGILEVFPRNNDV